MHKQNIENAYNYCIDLNKKPTPKIISEMTNINQDIVKKYLKIIKRNIKNDNAIEAKDVEEFENLINS